MIHLLQIILEEAQSMYLKAIDLSFIWKSDRLVEKKKRGQEINPSKQSVTEDRKVSF